MREREFDVLCNTGDGVYIVDANKRIVRWNKGAERILKYAEPDVLNRECYRVIAGRGYSEKPLCGQNCKIHSGAVRGALQKSFDFQTRTSDGEPLWLNISIVGASNADDPFVAHIFRDVTKERKTALALDQFLYRIGNQSAASGENTGEPAARHPEAGRTATCREPVTLSTREIEVLTLLAEGLSTKSLAQKLNISHFTARNHIQNILVKLELHSKAQAVSYAFKKGIL